MTLAQHDDTQHNNTENSNKKCNTQHDDNADYQYAVTTTKF